jgi:hypothetical protein
MKSGNETHTKPHDPVNLRAGRNDLCWKRRERNGVNTPWRKPSCEPILHPMKKTNDVRNRNQKPVRASVQSEVAASGQEAPVFPQTLHHVRLRTGKPGPKPGPQKRDNIFSKSRDTREDRGERQIKTSHNPQTFSRSR